MLCTVLAGSAAAQCASPIFPVPALYAAGSQPTSVAAGDFNGDGVSDLAVANLRSHNVSILIGDGAGGFGPPTNFAVPQEPSGVAVGDFNKDGKSDLAMSHIFGGPVSVMFGDGAGGFSAASVVATGSNPVGVAVGDFNGDGNPDIAAATLGEQLILLGNGAGGFTVRNISTGSANAVAAADFNGDGVTDAAFAVDSPGWRVAIVLGNSSGTFSHFSHTVNQPPRDIAFGEFNGDGRPDVAVVGQHSAPSLTVLLNDGAGGLGQSVVFTVNLEPRAVAVGDFNTDGKADVAVASAQGNSVQLFAGNGLGNFTAGATQYVIGRAPQALVAGDFNADGKADLVSANAISTEVFLPPQGNVSVLLGDGAGAFNTPRSFLFPSLNPASLAVGDFNNNGRSDVVNTFPFTPLVGLSIDDGAGGLMPPALFGLPSNAVSVTAADFNADGNFDYATAHFDAGIVAVFHGTGAGGFLISPHNPVGFGANLVMSGNFNGDARADLVVGRESGDITVLLSNASGGFNLAPGSPFAADAQTFVVGDFNGDGSADLATARSPANTVTILLNDGTGRLTASSTTGIPVSDFTELRLAAADLNHDGHADLVSANARKKTVTVFLGNGAGGLGAGTNFAAGATGLDSFGPVDLAIADFDGDTHADVATSSNDGFVAAGGVSILRGSGTGALGTPERYVVGGSPGRMVVGNFNADNRPDLAVTSGGTSITVLLNSHAPQPCLSVNDATVTEGDAGTLDANFTVTLSAPSAETVRVNFSLADTTTSPGADFTAVSGRLAFAPGETTKTVSVPVRGDVLDESDETFRILLSSPSGAVVADGEGLGTITDNDPVPTLKVNDITVSEGGFLIWNFTVTLSAPSGRDITVQYATADGTAIASTFTVTNDYANTFGTLTIPAGQATATIGVVVAGDNTFEPDEDFFLNLSNAVNATIEDGQGRASIPNDDPVPTLGFNGTAITEGNAGTQSGSIMLFLSNPTTQTVTLGYATADDTATAGSDYVASAGTITFNPGETEKTIPVNVLGDTTDEESELFFVDIGNVQNATIGSNNRAAAIIADDDGPTVSVNDVSVDEGQSGVTNAVFTLTLSAASVQGISVRVTTSPGTATAGTDYSPPSFTLTFPAGTLTRTVTIAVVGDTVTEADEDFFVNLSNPVNVTIADGQGVGVIKNDDAGTTMQFTGATFNAAEGGHSVTVTVSRFGDTAAESFVSYATADGTATERKDYIGAAGRLRFAPGETSRSFDILVTDDRFNDDGESFQLTLSNPVGGALGSQTSSTVAVADNDSAHGPSPVKDASFDTEFFVRQHYADFLNRVPDQDGLNFWMGQTTGCGASDLLVCRINVSASFFLSIENQETGYLTYRAHKAAYGNLPGKPVPLTLREHLAGSRRIGEGVEVGIGDWQLRLEANKAAFFDEFVTTARFTALYGGMTSGQYVDALNQNAGGPLSPSERLALIDALTSGTRTRAQALRAVAEDADFAAAERNRAFVLAQYFGYLRRNPDEADFRGIPDPNFDGYNFWLGKLNLFNGDFIQAEMVRAFIESIEYGERFGQ